MVRKHLAIGGFVCAVFCCTPAVAQDYYVAPIGPGTLPGNITWVSGLVLQDQLYGNQSQLSQAQQRVNARPNPPDANRVQTNTPGLSFAASMERRRANYRTIVQNWRAARTSPGADYEALLTDTARQAESEARLVRNFGVRTNNLADAYSYWLLMSWLTANQSDAALSRAQFQSFRGQLEAELSGVAVFAYASDEVKQMMTDSLFAQTLVMEQKALRAKNNPTERSQLANLVNASVLQSMKVDLTAMRLTEAGFVPK